MAEFEVKCPHCGVELIVPEEWAGMDGECPSCKKSFTIALKSRKLPDPRKKSSGNCNLIIDNYETEKRIDVIAAIRELKNTVRLFFSCRRGDVYCILHFCLLY